MRQGTAVNLGRVHTIRLSVARWILVWETVMSVGDVCFIPSFRDTILNLMALGMPVLTGVSTICLTLLSPFFYTLANTTLLASCLHQDSGCTLVFQHLLLVYVCVCDGV